MRYGGARLERSALEERLNHRVRKDDQRARRWNGDEIDEPQPGDDAARDAAPVLARELRGEQRKDDRRDCRGKDLLREVHEFGRVVHAGDVTRREGQREKPVEKERELAGGRADNDQPEENPGYSLEARVLQVDDRPVLADR